MNLYNKNSIASTNQSSYSVKEEFITSRHVRQGYYVISASGSGYLEGSVISTNDKSKLFLATQTTIYDMEYKSVNTKRACITSAQCASKAEFCSNQYCFVKYWQPMKNAQKIVHNIKLDDRMLLWIKPLDYCQELSNLNANKIVMYPNSGFNTFNIEQLFDEIKATPNEGHILISAKTIKYVGLFCQTTVSFNFADRHTYYEKDYDQYNPDKKAITDKKRVEMKGLSITVNGVVEETEVDPARVFFLISSLYSLYLLVNKIFEYIMYYLHWENQKFKQSGMRVYRPQSATDEQEDESASISVIS